MKQEDTLMRSPLFQLSLSSKELFHSNFLYWMAVSHPEYFNALIKNLIPDCNLGLNSDNYEERVHREENDFDFSVRSAEGFSSLIIENKVKCVPSIDQLKKYDDKAAKDENYSKCKKCLLSLATDFLDKEDIKKEAKWQIVSYGDLAEKMKETLETNPHPETETYHWDIINDYINFVTGLHCLAKNWTAGFDSSWFPDESKYTIPRIKDYRDKIRFSSIACLLKKFLYENHDKIPIKNFVIITDKNINDIVKKDYAPFANFFINFGYTQKGGGFIDVMVKVNNDLELGIQIQGYQYRRFIGRCPKDFDLVGKAKKLDWWFIDKLEFGEEYGKITLPKEGKYKTKKNDGMFCQFSDNFKYQYRLLKESATVKEVFDQVLDDIRLIIERNHDNK